MVSATGYEIDIATLRALLAPEGQNLLAELAGQRVDETTILGLSSRLRQGHTPGLVAAALETSLLRQRAQKFTRADRMYFTRQALEQASAEVISRHRAVRLSRYELALDLGCGIGGDALALAAHTRVVAVDLNPVRLLMTAANGDAYGVSAHLQPLRADMLALPLRPGLPFWADPARRAGERRLFRLQEYFPPLPPLLALAARAPGAGIKLSPGVDYDELAALLGTTPYEVEIISVQGEAREAALWLGELRTTARRATLLPGGHTLTADRPAGRPALTTPGRYLYEPDAAVIRAHLVEQLAALMGAAKIEDEIAYLTTDSLVETPFARAYRVIEWMPFNLKQLNRRLREMNIGELIVKKRGFAVDPEQFRRRLNYGGGTAKVVLVLTHVLGKPTAILGEPIP